MDVFHPTLQSANTNRISLSELSITILSAASFDSSSTKYVCSNENVNIKQDEKQGDI